MRNVSAILAILFYLIPGAAAQTESSVVTVRALAPAEPLKAGNPSVLTIELDIADRYHINSDRPFEDYLIPTQLELEPVPGMVFGETKFPTAVIRKFSFSPDSPMAVFEGIAKITVAVTPASDVESGNVEIRGRVHYQACNDTTCLPPAWQPFGLTVRVENSGTTSPSGKAASIPPPAGQAVEGDGDVGVVPPIKRCRFSGTYWG